MPCLPLSSRLWWEVLLNLLVDRGIYGCAVCLKLLPNVRCIRAELQERPDECIAAVDGGTPYRCDDPVHGDAPEVHVAREGRYQRVFVINQPLQPSVFILESVGDGEVERRGVPVDVRRHVSTEDTGEEGSGR